MRVRGSAEKRVFQRHSEARCGMENEGGEELRSSSLCKGKILGGGDTGRGLGGLYARGWVCTQGRERTPTEGGEDVAVNAPSTSDFYALSLVSMSLHCKRSVILRCVCARIEQYHLIYAAGPSHQQAGVGFLLRQHLVPRIRCYHRSSSSRLMGVVLEMSKGYKVLIISAYMPTGLDHCPLDSPEHHLTHSLYDELLRWTVGCATGDADG